VFTGDHSLTALAIAKMLGIAGSGIVITGPEIDRMNDEALTAVVLECNVYARASPENKLRIVRALQVGDSSCGANGLQPGWHQSPSTVMLARCD
jgi:Ca2+-transporting ATPase